MQEAFITLMGYMCSALSPALFSLIQRLNVSAVGPPICRQLPG